MSHVVIDYVKLNGTPAAPFCVAISLQQFFAKQKPADYSSKLAAPVAIFEALCCSPPAMSDERRAICVALADELEQVLQRCYLTVILAFSRGPWCSSAMARSVEALLPFCGDSSCTMRTTDDRMPPRARH